jgi:hypothetical protein
VIAFNRIIPALQAKNSDEKILPDKKAIMNEGKTTFFLMACLISRPASLTSTNLSSISYSLFKIPVPLFATA